MQTVAGKPEQDRRARLARIDGILNQMYQHLLQRFSVGRDDKVLTFGERDRVLLAELRGNCAHDLGGIDIAKLLGSAAADIA